MESLRGNGWRRWRAWFNVESTDYLQRGGSVHGLRGKLDCYLESQNEDSASYPHVYLVTAPRFLGYSFNPVSFWYLYDGRKNLKAMILEVNNTFDERRMYFLKESLPIFIEENPQQPSIGSQGSIASLQDPPSAKFTNVWSKDFHVSPFNSRKGAYSLTANDPFFPHLTGSLPINNTITLTSSKKHAKLVARVFSTAPSLDPSTFGSWHRLKFIASWWWVGFVTFPRIVREAAKLFFRRKLHVWYRPEVLKSSIGRQATAYETAIAYIFQDFLRVRISQSSLPFALKYTPATVEDPATKIFRPQSLPSGAPSPDPVILQPTTPLFYTSLALSNDISKYLELALQCSDPLKSTVYTNNPPLLQSIIIRHLQKPLVSLYQHNVYSRLPLSTRLRWLPIRFLRHWHLSALDWHVIHSPDPVRRDRYRRATLKLLVAKYLAFGVVEIVDVILWLVKAWLLWQHLEAFSEWLVGDWNWSLVAQDLGLTLRFAGVHLWWLMGFGI
ncbi:MAG: hypothetical protein Q9217_004649 [Psora testacea]